MRLGPALIGAVVGAVVGVAAQIALESWMGREANWFAIVIGLMTGIGARSMAGDGLRHVSYARAALAAVIALAAMVGGSYAASEMVRKKNVDAYQTASASPAPAAADAKAEGADRPAEGAEEGEAADEPAIPPENDDTARDEVPGTETTDTGSTDAGSTDAAEPYTPIDDTAVDTAEVDVEAEANVVDAEGEDAGDAGAGTTADEPLDPNSIDQASRQPTQLPAPSPWQYAYFGIGTLLAYVLAHGGGKSEHPAAPAEA